jgi:hypothetical protein
MEEMDVEAERTTTKTNKRERDPNEIDRRMSTTKAVKKDMNAIYDRTMDMLMHKNGYHPQEQMEVQQVNIHKCYVCTAITQTIKCGECLNYSCFHCIKECQNESCGGKFCTFCTVANYELSYDRVFCLNCNEESKSILMS